jgi:hypothetical protein
MTITQINAVEVIEIEELGEGRAGVRFLNWKVQAKPFALRKAAGDDSYIGAGVYAIGFDNHLIYIGSYLGSGGRVADFSGDVVKDRWWAHIGAITARGCKVHIAKRSLDALKLELGASHVMVEGLLKATDHQLLHKDAGDLATLRKLRFAGQRSQDFFASRNNCLEILKRFQFVYVRFNRLAKNEDRNSLKDRIESAEKNLIQKLAPICNAKHVKRQMEPVQTHIDEVAMLIEAEFAGALNPPM